MSVTHLEQVAEASHRAFTTTTWDLTIELQQAVMSAANDGESLTTIAAAAKIPTLAVLDALEETTSTPPITP
jgi:hypothetical protein